MDKVDKLEANGDSGIDAMDVDGIVADTGKSTVISSDVSLPNDVLERLYQRYSIKQRRAGLECFLATSVLFDLWAIFVPQPEKSWESLGMLVYLFKKIF